MSSLFAGVSGLRAHQGMLDVVGNNLANINTPGYKAARATFADLISETVDSGRGPTDATGGVNPIQKGLGARLSAISKDLSQGSFQSTGRTLDMGIEGEGYFVVSDGRQNLYTRAGTFDLDPDNNLVMLGSGMRVQARDGSDVNIDLDETFPAEATSRIDMGGNLSAGAEVPTAEELTSIQPFQAGSRASLGGANAEPFAFSDGDTLAVTVDGGAPQNVVLNTADFAAIGAATAAEVANVLNTQLSGITATAAGGQVTITSDQPGSTSSLDIDDPDGVAAALGLSTSLTLGSSVAATATTPLNDVPQTLGAYVAGDEVNLTGTDASGTPVSATFIYGTGPGQNGTTLGDMVSFVDANLPNSNVSIQGDGTIAITANDNGSSALSVSLTDSSSNTGGLAWSSLGFAETTAGSDGATSRTAIEVIDGQGEAHTVELVFNKVSGNSWDVSVELPDGDGAIVDGEVRNVQFRGDGAFDTVAGIGLGDASIEITWAGQAVSQRIDLDFGTPGGFDGVTQFGGATTAGATDQDGVRAGSIASLSVSADGTIQGIYTNGRIQDLVQLQVATFSNPGGLSQAGDNLLAVSTNSGPPNAGVAQAGRAGKIVSGVLENSNVDIAQEFTRLITAQRGFQVNSRTITTTDELLQELANLVR